MKLAAVAVAVVLLAGCAVEAAPTPTVTVTATPEAFTPTMKLTGCVWPGFDFLYWLYEQGPEMFDANLGPVGAVVITETGDWAAGSASNGRGDILVFITPSPLAPGAEVIHVGRLDVEYSADGHFAYDLDTYESLFEENTSWRGDLLAVGEEAAAATLACNRPNGP
jgi:hypothetical protein